MPCVFISHSSLDRLVVEREIISPLRAHGVNTWYSTDDIQTASEWERQVHDGLIACDWFLVVLTPRSVTSEWVRREVHWAILKRPNKIVPVMLEMCEPEDLHLGLLPIQYIDFRRGFTQALKRLLTVWGVDVPTQVDSLYRTAEAAIAKEDWAAAIKYLEEVLKLDSSHAQAQADLHHAQQQELASIYHEGCIHLQWKRWSEALECLLKVQSIDRRYRDVGKLIATAEAKLCEEVEARDRGSAGAATNGETGHAKNKSAYKIWGISLGVIFIGILLVVGLVIKTIAPARIHSSNAGYLLRQKKYIEAEAEYRNAIAISSDVAMYHDGLGNALFGQEKYKEAEAEFRKAVELSPAVAIVHSDLGWALHRQERYEEAEAEFIKATEIDPNRAFYHFSLGYSLYAQQKYGEGEVACRKATELAPDDASYHDTLGDSLYKQQKYGEAEAAYRKATALDNNNADYHNSLGGSLTRQEKYEEGEAEFRKATELDQNNVLYHDNLGFALFRQQKYGEAEAEYRKTIELDQNNATYHNSLGDSLSGQQKYGEAEAAYRKATELDQNNARYHINLALSLMHQKKHIEAAQEYIKAHQIDPKTKTPNENLKSR